MTNELHRARSGSKTGGDSLQLTSYSELSTESTTELELSRPPLVVISSRMKSPDTLVSCVNTGVESVKYSYETTSLSKLFQTIGTKLKGRQALSIAFLVHGQPGCFKICSQKVVSAETLREDRELKEFFLTLTSSFLERESQYTRIDFLLCPVAQNPAGEQLLQQMKELLGVPVFASSEILGAYSSENGQEETGSVRIGKLYFDEEKLKEWTRQSQQTMASFEKIRTVGKGAHGAAVLYRKKDDDSRVILKEINLLALTKAERKAALNEVKILSMFDHPNIISYYDNFEEDGVLMIEMEYADGGTLERHLKQRANPVSEQQTKPVSEQQAKPMSEQEILHMFSQMVDALKYLHDHNVLHRDLKTANIFLTKEGIVKLGDFGISKVLSDTNEAANTVLGTPFYISPEICEGSPYNAKSDIWALGCVLYEMACLQKTFEGTNLPALVHKIVQVSFAPVKGDYSDGLKQLIEDMLQKDPKSRPSASEICNTRLPQLKKNFHWKDNPAIPSNDDTNTDIMTSAKSFLYYLDGHSLLLRPLHAPINAKIDQVAVGFSHVIAVTNEHTVFSWGAGSRGQLGHGDITPRSTPQKIEALSGRGITRVKCGGEFSVFISDNDVIMSCGRGDMGALGHGDSKDCLKPRLIEALLSHDATAVSCGADHVVTLTSDSCVFAWGAGGHGRLGTGSEENCSTPMEITVHSPYSKMKEVIVDMRCGADGTMFLTPTGRVFACGNNHENKLGLNQRETFIMQMQRRILNKAQLQVPQALVPTPLKELGKHRVVDLSLGPTHTSVLVETGRVFTFGRNSEGQLCTGNCQPQNTPSVVKALHAKPMSVISSELSTIVTTEDNSFLIWGSRPLVKSPLTDILNENDIPQMKSTETDATKMRSISVTNEGKVSEDGQVPVDVNSSSLTGSSGHLSSCETTPEGKKSRNPSVEDVVIASPKAGSNDSIKRSNSSALSSESVDQSNSTLNEMQKKPSISNLLDAPHTLALCSEASKYLSQLGDLLAEATETTKIKGGGGKHRESFPSSYQLQTRSLKRGMSISSCDFVSPEGVIMKPTAIDLVGKSGILSSLSTQGFRNVKVEGISCFGCNMLVLIQAQELLESSAPVSSEERGTLPETSVKIGRNLFERRARSTRHTVSSAEPSPPPSTQSSPHPGFHGDATTRSIDTTISEDSQVPTWIQRELQEAMKEQKAKSENAEKRTSACMMQAEFPTESVSESESKVMPPTRMFVASKEDISHAQNQRVSLPGSMSPESRQVELEPDPAKVGKSNPDVVVTNEQGKLVKHPRNETIHEMQNKQLSPYQGSSSPSRRSVSKSSKSDSETPATQTESKVKLNSGVIRSTIPEHNRKGVSLATVDKAEQLAEQKAKAAKETSPRRLRVAASTTNISQAPSNTSALNLKRTRSNTDVTSPINKPASKNLSHAKLSSRQSMPVGKSGVRFTSHVRGSSEPTPKPSTGVRSHASVNRAPVSGRLPPVQVQKGEHRKSNKELRHSTHGESSLSPQTSSGSLRGNPATKRSNQLREGMMKHSEEGGGASCVDSTPHEQLSSSSEGEVFIAPGKGTKNVSSSLKPTGRKLMKQQHRTGHAIAVTDISPYEDPAPRIRRPSGGRTHSRSSTGNRQTREDGSNKVEVSAVQQSEESEEQRKAEQERAQHELEEREQEQLRLSQQREEHAQLQEEIQRLQSEVTKQETQLQENANLVKDLQKQVQQLQAKATDSPPSSPSRKRRWPRRGSQRREDTNKNTNRTKSSICTMM